MPGASNPAETVAARADGDDRVAGDRQPVPVARAQSSAPHPSESPEPEEEPAVNLGRIAWSFATLAFAVAGLVLLMESYYGYAGVTFAVAAAAGINLL